MFFKFLRHLLVRLVALGDILLCAFVVAGFSVGLVLAFVVFVVKEKINEIISRRRT